ncbi:MAG: hypothetical protein ACREYE_05295 [Gammaproteobacteria bacterium]
MRGARNPHVFPHTLRLLVSSLRLAPAGLARRFAPGETRLRAVRLAGGLARDDFFTSSGDVDLDLCYRKSALDKSWRLA